MVPVVAPVNDRIGSRRHSPSLALLAAEPTRALFDWMASHFPSAPLPRGDGHPILVYPGFGAGAWSTERLRLQLRDAGHEALDWERGHNHGPVGDVAGWLEQLTRDVRALHARYGRKVSLVGWSLGGIYAREIARIVPEQVRQVVTLASPFAGRSAANTAWLNEFLNASALPRAVEWRRLKRPLPVPSTSIYSKSDGVVPWQACLQAQTARSENVEVLAVSHMGMGSNRQVIELVADRLAQPEGTWKRLRAA